MAKSVNKIRESGDILNILLVIGFLGIVWLVIYGNLSGNLGFQQTSTAFTNDTVVLNGTGNLPASASTSQNPSLTNVIVINATAGELITSGNYTIVGATIYASATVDAIYNNSEVNVSATLKEDGTSAVNSNNVINNVTTGVTTFFTFSNTLFTISAIVLLITILLGLLAVVVVLAKGGRKKGFA